jgi:hypothetical protein
MPVTEHLEDPGRFTIELDAAMAPPNLLTSIRQFDHMVILPQRMLHPNLYADADLLATARYAGVVLEKEYDRRREIYRIMGQGLARWLGDSQGNGPTLAANVSYSAATVDEVLDLIANGGILPPAITPGTITTTGVGTFTGDFQEATTCIQALREVTAALNLTWRINPDGTLDACLKTRDEVFRTTSSAIQYAVVRDGWGSDPLIRSVEAETFLTRVDATDYATRIIHVGANFDGSNQILAFRNRSSIPYLDIHGNEMVWSVPITTPPSDVTIDIDTWFDRQFEDWDVSFETEIDALEEEFANGQAHVGDYFFVHDAPSLRDEANGRWHRGFYRPFLRLQATEADWHLRASNDVLCRHSDGTWTRVSKYVRAER